MANKAAADIAKCAAESIRLHGRFNFLATGGETARFVYRELRRYGELWQFWHVYLTDERCVPVGSQQRNDRMVRAELLDLVPIPGLQVYPIAGELGAVAGAARYAKVLATVDGFDLALLGLGEDGHVASLFPGMTPSAGETALAVFGAPKPPTERISVSSAVLHKARRIFLLAGGEAKRKAVSDLHCADTFFWTVVGPTPRISFYFDREATSVAV